MLANFLSGCRAHLLIQESTVLYQPSDRLLPLHLVMRNEGNVDVTLFQIDGGCSCRKVDQSKFPLVLKPGASLELGVQITTTVSFSQNSFNFTCSTNHGDLRTPAKLLALPRHHFSPETYSTALAEHADWKFEVVYLSTYRTDETAPPVAFDIPGEFTQRKIDERIVEIDEKGELSQKVTRYEVILKDRKLGLHRATIALLGSGSDRRTPMLELPLSWNRIPYLSSMPERVSIGSQPVRVFLRCPDANVEFTKLELASNGIKAELASPREVVVRLDKNAPDVIDGFIEVGTTAKGNPLLKVPVVRYAPKIELGKTKDREKVATP